jgi:hypothetical protein
VLLSSSDAHHRAIAAQMLGYGHQSREQIDALVRASLDPDDGNDAVRAIEVLAGAKPNLARMVPTDPFVQLLHSGKWSDHNKASLVLVALTKTRDQKLLDQLRTEALDSLLEMAQWRNIGHAEAALSIIGRIAGIDEETLNQLMESHRPEAIIGKVNQQ